MNIRDLVEFDPSQWSYVGPIANCIDEGYQADSDPSKRDLITSRIAPLFEIARSYLILGNAVVSGKGQPESKGLSLVCATTHLALAVFTLYEGGSWAQAAKEGLAAPITFCVVTAVEGNLEIYAFIAGLASLSIPSIGRLLREVENYPLSWAQSQINILEGVSEPYARKWTLQPKPDLIAEGIAAALVNNALAFWGAFSTTMSSVDNFGSAMKRGFTAIFT